MHSQVLSGIIMRRSITPSTLKCPSLNSLLRWSMNGRTSWNVGTKADQCLMRLILKYSNNISLFLFFVILLLVLLLLVVVLLSGGSLSLLLSLRGLGVSLLLAGPLTKPLGQLLSRPLGELVVFLLPGGLQVFGSDHLPATFVQFLPVVVGPGVGSALVLGVHADLGWVLAGEGLGVETLLQCLGSELSLLSLLQFLEIEFLGQFSLLVIVFVSLQLDDGLEQVLNLALHLVRVQSLPH